MDGNHTKSIRIEYFDVFRGIGVLLMVMGHVSFGKAFDIYIHAFHMPMFFFVSGYFYNIEKYDNILKFVIHKLKTLILPYTVFVLLCQAIHYVYTGEFSFSYFILSYFSSNHNRIDAIGALWFLLCLFTSEILFCLIERFVKNEKLRLFVIVVLTLIGNSIPFNLPLCIDSAMSCLLLLYIGYALRKKIDEKKLDKLLDLKIIVMIVLFLVNCVLIFINGSVNVRTNDYSNVILFWVNCISAIILYINLSIKIDSCKRHLIIKIRKGLKYIGRNSLIYLLLNELLIYVSMIGLKIIGINVIEQGSNLFFLYRLAIFVISMILLYVSTVIINRTKLKVLIGKF